MNILVLNSGSSSLKARVFNDDFNEIFHFEIERIGQKNCQYEVIKEHHLIERKYKRIKTFREAVKLLKHYLQGIKIDGIGQRVVHGGENYHEATLINRKLKAEIKKLFPLAELHNPINLECIEATSSEFRRIKQVAVFDTAFHQSIKETQYIYALPQKLYKKSKIRKYGFHGTSHKFVSDQLIHKLKKKSLKIVSCHLGNGSSITAIKNGKSLDTSMGLTPLAGIPMGTRSGDIDPGVVINLANKLGPQKTSELLNHQSGLECFQATQITC